MDQELIAYLDRRFDDLDRSLDRRFAEVNRRFDQQGQRFDQQDQRFDQQDRRFDQQDRRFDQQDLRIDDLRLEFRESHRQTQVVIEGLRSDIQAVAEGVTAVDEKLERFREDVDRRIDEDQATVRASFEVQHRKNGEFDRRITRIERARARPAGG